MDPRTEEILSRFKKSWNETEQFYEDLINNYQGFEKCIPIRQYIIQLRQNGEHLHFRLGTSMHTLMISRSVNFGLRSDQKYIRIEALDINEFEVELRNADKIYREYKISHLEDVRLSKLLKTLKDTLID